MESQDPKIIKSIEDLYILLQVDEHSKIFEHNGAKYKLDFDINQKTKFSEHNVAPGFEQNRDQEEDTDDFYKQMEQRINDQINNEQQIQRMSKQTNQTKQNKQDNICRQMTVESLELKRDIPTKRHKKGYDKLKDENSQLIYMQLEGEMMDRQEEQLRRETTAEQDTFYNNIMKHASNLVDTEPLNETVQRIQDDKIKKAYIRGMTFRLKENQSESDSIKISKESSIQSGLQISAHDNDDKVSSESSSEMAVKDQLQNMKQLNQSINDNHALSLSLIHKKQSHNLTNKVSTNLDFSNEKNSHQVSTPIKKLQSNLPKKNEDYNLLQVQPQAIALVNVDPSGFQNRQVNQQSNKSALSSAQYSAQVLNQYQGLNQLDTSSGDYANSQDHKMYELDDIDSFYNNLQKKTSIIIDKVHDAESLQSMTKKSSLKYQKSSQSQTQVTISQEQIDKDYFDGISAQLARQLQEEEDRKFMANQQFIETNSLSKTESDLGSIN